MKTVLVKKEVYSFDELSKEAQNKAINDDVTYIMETYDPDNEDTDPRIIEAAEEAERLRTPWFFGQIIYEKMEEDIKDGLRQQEFLKSGEMFMEPYEEIIPC